MESTYSKVIKDQPDYKELLKPYLKHWRWFVISTMIAIALAFLYLRYTTPEYAAQVKIQILEDQSSASELGAFKDIEMFTGGNTQVEDEIEILNSRSNLMEVVKKLGLHIKIKALGNIHDTELYNNTPLKLNFLVPDSLLYLKEGEFVLKVLNDTTFSFSEVIEGKARPLKTYSFGNTIPTEIGPLLILIPDIDSIQQLVGKEYNIKINPVSFVAQVYKEKLNISVISDLSNVATIRLEDPVKHKAIDILNSLVETYNNNGIEAKKQIADKTSDFINERINDISGNLSSVDQSAEELKTVRGITNVESQSATNFSIGAERRQELQNASIQLEMATSMKKWVDNEQGYDFLPSNVGLADPAITNTVVQYNSLINDRNSMLKSSNEKNPIIVNLDQQLSGLKKSLQSSLSSMINNLNLRVNNISGQLSQIDARIYAAPGNERALRDITRQQQTTETLYLYLLQKQVESQITFASATPKSNIIDRAYAISPFPVSPKRTTVLLAFVILGMLIPFAVVYIGQLLDNKVNNKVALEKLVGSVPVLAELPKLSKKENTLVKTGERTVFAEALRILRTNIDYIIKSKKTIEGKGTIIFVTSSVSGEGKTLVSSNLAMIFAKANKKVLLIGADIRNPKIYQFYSGKNVDRLGKPKRDQLSMGLTEFLIDRSIKIADIISPMLAHEQTVDVIYSGKIPPNPAELLMSDRMQELLVSVPADYDYIIVDTAPLMVVSDTLLISEYADQLLYVTRAHVTELKVLEFPLKLHKEGKIKGLSFIVNGVKSSNLGYGGHYGYGYGSTSKKWWKFGV